MVYIEGNYMDAFPMHEGVCQGCPASPLMLSLYMDQLEVCLELDLVKDGD